MDLQQELNDLIAKGEAPSWMTLPSYITISKGYRLKGETPKMMYTRVANAAASRLEGINDAQIYFDLMWKNWLCPASPVLANMGTDKGLPISCYGIDIGDSVEEISSGIFEMSALSKNGGGVGVNFNRVRPRGSVIKNGQNGQSDGIVGFMKMYDSTILAISQGSTRRGAASINLNIEHGDWYEFIRMRRPEGDINRQCGNLHHCTMIDDSFMHKVLSKDREARLKWAELMKTRFETGESYLMFMDNVNKANPEAYKKNGLKVDMTNICSEIVLHTDADHSFICCLSSLNLARYDEYQDQIAYLVEHSINFLNGVLNEFIDKARYINGMQKVVASAEKGRAIGLGVLGWHTYLQNHSMPFSSFNTMQLNNKIFREMKDSALEATKKLATIYGEPEWCKDTGVYNSHLLAVAPTRSNSIIAGDVSPSIEPIISNAYNDKTAKGIFMRKNPTLIRVLEKYQKNDEKTWKAIVSDNGSVQDIPFLTDEEKTVFLTAYEISQLSIVQQAAQRQKYICQAQSVNLFFSKEVDPKYFNKVHIEAWELGLKTLYYCRSQSGIKADISNRDGADCSSCEG